MGAVEREIDMYESDITKFIREYLKQHPEEV